MKKFIILTAFLCFVIPSLAQANLFDVDAYNNSSSGGTGVSTINLTAGQAFTVTVNPNDLWNAGALPRWSNADGLTHNLLATGSDDSGQPSGTLIGQDFGLWQQENLIAPYGSLVGQIGSDFFLIGTNYSGTAASTGTLKLFYWDSNNGDNTQYITANVNAVPIPGGVWLFAPGLIGLVGFKRKYLG